MFEKALETHQLTVRYDDHPVLWDLSLSVPRGKLVAIIGPNGAGKSTLIRTLLGIQKAVTGRISLLDEPLDKVRRRIAFVPQRSEVDWTFPVSVLDVVLMGCYGRLGWIRRPSRRDRQAAMEALDKVGMASYAKRQISQLSGGQQQRVFIARALVEQAELYFFDEPLAGVDMATEQVVIGIMRQLRDEGKSLFVVHHDLTTVESIYDWAILLNVRLVASGPIDEVFTAEALERAYGKNHLVLTEAMKLSQSKTLGLE
jgi:manganese/zinc/iron transport system ATP- binding protein